MLGQNKILLVDDDKQFLQIIKELLELENYKVQTATNVIDGFELFGVDDFDLVITDLKMGEFDGFHFIALLRKKSADVKIIMLTGVNNDEDEIKGLNLAVNDYIKKPVGFEVLLKRIELVLNQKKKIGENILESQQENLIVDIEKRIVTKNGKTITLTNTEFKLLAFFLLNKNVVFSRKQLLENVWHVSEYIDKRNIDAHVKNLRLKLNLTSIYSVRGIGYEWVE